MIQHGSILIRSSHSLLSIVLSYELRVEEPYSKCSLQNIILKFNIIRTFVLVFEQHIRNLEAEYLQEREQVKKRNKRQQRKNRDNFLVSFLV